MKKSALHQLADEKIGDVYAANAEFAEKLLQYYKEPTQELRERLWTIAFQCGANILKIRFGHWWSWEKIEDLLLDELSILFSRIDNRTKWPEGYPIYNLPSRMKQIFLCAYYRPKHVKERQEISWDYLVEEYGEKAEMFITGERIEEEEEYS